MLGNKVIPNHLRRAALESVLEFPGDMAAGIPRVDAVVVEVSSLKQYILEGYYLNAHKIYGIVSESGLPHQPVLNGQTQALPDGHPLKMLRMEVASRQTLRDDLRSIQDQVRAPVMTVDHLYSVMPNGEPPAERSKLTEELRLVSQQENMPFYSTKELIVEYGIDRALLDQNHYRSDFEEVVGDRMYLTLESAARNSSL